MINDISVSIVRDRLWMDENVVYDQVPGWCAHVTHNLRLSVIYHDEDVKREKLPCIIWITGGGWKWVDVQAYLPNLIDLAHRGYVLASVEYQCSNDATFPAAILQVKSAIRYLRANAERYSINPDKMALVGESSGGYLATMVGVTNGMSEFESGMNLSQSSEVQAVCSWYTPVHLDKLAKDAGRTNKDLDQNIGELIDRFLNAHCEHNPELVKRADPTTYINKGNPPFLLFHGTEDKLVNIECSEVLYKTLEENGVPVEYYRIKGADHADYHFFQPKVMDIIADFFDSKLIK